MSIENIREQQRQVWNEFSSGWQKQEAFAMAWMEPIGAALLDSLDLKDGDQVLDMATGTGEPGLTAAGHVGDGHVVGVDVAEDMVAVATENARARGITNYSARVTNEATLPFEANVFDAVMCRFGVMYFADPPAGLREMGRVLKPGRMLAMSAWTVAEKNPWATTAAAVASTMLSLPSPPPDSPGLYRHAAPGALSRLFEDAGIGDIEEHEITGTLIFESPEDYWTFILDIVAPVARPLADVDNATREGVKRGVLAAAQQHEEAGSIVFPWSAWVVSGRK